MSTIKWFTVLIDSGDIFDHRVVVSPVDVLAYGWGWKLQ